MKTNDDFHLGCDICTAYNYKNDDIYINCYNKFKPHYDFIFKNTSIEKAMKYLVKQMEYNIITVIK
jgi:hypothetical protein